MEPNVQLLDEAAKKGPGLQIKLAKSANRHEARFEIERRYARKRKQGKVLMVKNRDFEWGGSPALCCDGKYLENIKRSDRPGKSSTPLDTPGPVIVVTLPPG